MKPKYADRIHVPPKPELEDVSDVYTGTSSDILIRQVNGRYQYEIHSHATFETAADALAVAELILHPKPVDINWKPLFVCPCWGEGRDDYD